MQRYLTAMSNGTNFCKRMKLFRKGGMNKLSKESDQGRLLNSDTVHICFPYTVFSTKDYLRMENDYEIYAKAYSKLQFFR